MLVLKIIIGIIILAGAFFSFLTFNNHCNRKFGYRFFTMTSFVIVGASLILISIGHEWRLDALKENGDILNGIILMIIGVLISMYLVFKNFKETNFVYGLGGSIVQLSIFGVLTYLGIVVLIITIAIFIVGNMGAQRVYVVNR
ncbi:hypothetical protein O4H49_02335 [Kiloniella laminariae]|uniref:Uncharacterized protein n=1 Tax=Kiloniella laminariae TaxID=454162 RepID=A0ABT4LER9_9PROT|nr:hypothetical protein [Kiloniella laminariae]MCZ4279598.1 hypothetical protein [Kiloniella laminariae]